MGNRLGRRRRRQKSEDSEEDEGEHIAPLLWQHWYAALWYFKFNPQKWRKLTKGAQIVGPFRLEQQLRSKMIARLVKDIQDLVAFKGSSTLFNDEADTQKRCQWKSVQVIQMYFQCLVSANRWLTWPGTQMRADCWQSPHTTSLQIPLHSLTSNETIQKKIGSERHYLFLSLASATAPIVSTSGTWRETTTS